MSILSLIGLLVVIGWIFGGVFHIGASLIHLLVVIALVLFILDVIRGRRVL